MSATDPAFVSMGNLMITDPVVGTYASSNVPCGVVGTVKLSGSVEVYCRDPQQARDIALAFTECASLMEARAAEGGQS